ncbi:MAG: ferritin family protein [Theionarchaea archaeon]|nr:ferritin family protein [Theionarchaea archaeon]
MDLSSFSLKDILLAAMKSEVDSKAVYETLSERVENAFLKNRLLFLSHEEEKHRQFIHELYTQNISTQEYALPAKTPVPVPFLQLPSESEPLSQILESAMGAEQATHEFYKEMAREFSDSQVQTMLLYFADMELGHYRLLQDELKTLKRFEDFDTEWPMMNVGP